YQTSTGFQSCALPISPTISSRPAPWCASTPAPPPRTRRPEMAISLTAQPTVPGSQVLAYGAARGDLVVPNDDLIGPIDSSDEWKIGRAACRARAWIAE